MEKNKQNKKRKPNIKVISASLLVIILVSMLALPASASHTGNFPELLGQWKMLENFGESNSTINMNNGFNVSVRIPYIDATTGEISYVDWGACKLVINTADELLVGFSFLPQYQSGDYIEFRNGIIYYKINGVGLPSVNISNELYPQLRVVEFTSDYVEAWSGGTEASTFYDYILEHAEPYVPPEPKTPLGNILDVFLGIGGWIATAVTSLIGIFYSAEAGKLTVIGVLSVASLAISVIFLLIGVIQNFMHFRS